MYDQFSLDYDRFVDWPGRLEFELPFILEKITGQGTTPTEAAGRYGNLPHEEGAVRVLDAACGTGWHAIALAQRGYQAAGADLSAAMIARARENAAGAGVAVRFEPLGFGSLAQTFGADPFDGVLCLGNSLPHLLSAAELQTALVDFAGCLKPGGKLIVQNRNFDLVMAMRQRWMEPQARREGEAEWLFLRFYDFDPDGLITFNIVALQRQGKAPWQQTVHTTRLRPLLHDEMCAALQQAGFSGVESFGSLGGEPFDPASSGNLVLTATRA
jgi:SAM-dependent methyltransferase